MDRKTIIIIPTYNEKDNISKLIEELETSYPKIDILIIDDNSPDQTAQIVKKIQKKYNNIKLIERPSKLGLGTAYKLGFNKAMEWSYDYVIEMDADLSHQTKYISKILECLEKFDLVIGSRYTKNGGTKNWSMGRKILSRYGNLYAKIILNVPINDLTAGFVGIRTELLKKINLEKINGVGYAFQKEIKYRLFKAGAKTKEIPITFLERTNGKSKMSGNIIKEGIIMPWKIRFRP